MADRKVEYLLIGGGLAAGNCARWLRGSGADGSIMLVGREPDLPYERPPLSKGYMRGEQSREDALVRAAGIAESCAKITALSISAGADAALADLAWRDRCIAERPNQPALLDALDRVFGEMREIE